ncbi:MAG: hypothetical protein AAF492_09115, partial [Verrucomicrobiota bacterium]
MKPTRRAFMQGGAAVAGALAVSGSAEAASEESDTLRDRLVQCLGGPWPEPTPLKVNKEKDEQKDGYRIEFLRYDVEPGDPVAGLLLVPDGVDANHPAPGMAVWHQHNGQYHLGKNEPGGLAGNPMHHTGVALAKEGYVVLCPDALCFEERQDPTGKLRGGAFERFEFLRYVVNGQCM